MDKHYYIPNLNSERGFDEITESEWLAIVGDDDHSDYASQVYRGKISIDDVPEDKRQTVSNIVKNKIARWGAFDNREISDSEALDIITGGNA